MDRRRAYTLGGLFVAALVIRVYGLRFGLPYRYHIDETFYVAGALRMAGDAFRLPIETHGPNLFYCVLLVEYALYFVMARLTGLVTSLATFEQLYRQDPSVFVLLARTTSAVAGSLTLIPTYYLTKAMAKARATPVIASVLLGFSFQHVRESHYGTPDVFAGLLVAGGLAACFHYLGKKRDLSLYVAAACFGLATGTKFTNVLTLVPLVGCYIVAASNRSESGLGLSWSIAYRKSIAIAGVVFAASFAFAYPNLVIRPSAFWDYVRFLVQVGEEGFVEQFRIDPAPAAVYYVRSLTEWGLGYAMAALAMIGVCISLLRRRAPAIILFSFAAIYFLFLSRAPYYASRYLVPLLPILCGFAAVGIAAIARWLAQHVTMVGNIGWLVLLTAAALVQPTAAAARYGYLMTHKDTRTLAKQWIEQNVQAGTGIALDWQKHAPPLRALGDDHPTMDLPYRVVVADGIGLPRFTIEEYRTQGIEYLVKSSYIDDLLLTSATDQVTKAAFEVSIDEDTEIVYAVSPYRSDVVSSRFVFDSIFGPVIDLWKIERPGPAITIYRVEGASMDVR